MKLLVYRHRASFYRLSGDPLKIVSAVSPGSANLVTVPTTCMQFGTDFVMMDASAGRLRTTMVSLRCSLSG